MSRSNRIIWLCEELGIAYELEELEMFSTQMYTASYRRISPLGKVPAIDDRGFTLWETQAIMEYLIASYSDSSLLPDRSTGHGAQVVQWMCFGENPLTVIMGEIAAHAGPMPEDRKQPALIERGKLAAPELITVVENELARQQSDGCHYFVDKTFTAADIMLVFGLNIATYLGFVDDSTPLTKNYCDFVGQRPAFQRAMAR